MYFYSMSWDEQRDHITHPRDQHHCDIEQSCATEEYKHLALSAAWKHIGYPGLSSRLASQRQRVILRKFARLNVRVLLKLQNDIVQRERELDCMDEHSKSSENGGCGSLRLDALGPRGDLIDQLSDLLRDYSKAESRT